MRTLKGIPVTRGLVIGRAAIIEAPELSRVAKRRISPSDVEHELERLEAALEKSVEELNELHAEAQVELGTEAAKIFLFHIGALRDRSLLDPMRKAIAEEHVAAEYATAKTFGDLARAFGQRPDTTFRSKVSDLNDLADRVLRHLGASKLADHSHLAEDTVVIAPDLTPSQTAAFDRSKIVAFVTDLGGPTSHTAIVARALDLPAVVACNTATAEVDEGQTVIVDGQRGLVILDPDEDTIARYERERERSDAYRVSLNELADLPAVTADGVDIDLMANIEFPMEAAAIGHMGGQGVGLYRTEFLFLTSDTEPTEEVHYQAYAECVKNLDGMPLTIRTVDLGADKYTQRRKDIPERNPFLGLRSIRYCLQDLDMFRTQLRAILRASALGPMRVMFPLVTSITEFRQAKMLLHDAMEDLDDKGLAYDKDIKVGVMIEVPSAALMAPTFAREVDFFSIGTNDLVQYTLAVDRTNERVAHMYNPAHPAVLKLIRTVVRAADKRGIPVSCCGEAAAEPDIAPLLIGLGLRTLSLTAQGIPPLKRLIRSLDIEHCERIAAKAMRFDSDSEAAAYVRDQIQRLVPDAFDGRSVDLPEST
ncbi:MAG: phosphoenolpyruvate--protein phosphotransferase [Planctomycetota bacterium]